jgi:uncharacterized protein (UPF0332 family)
MSGNFLNKLKKEEKLKLVDPSENICDSYKDKSVNCLKSAKLLLQNGLFENSIGMSYYAMYNILLALLFRVGVKCENHTGSILLLKLLFGEGELFKLISEAKKERIDKQYYVATEKDEITTEIATELFSDAENFTLKVKTLITNLNNDIIENARDRFQQV